MSARLVALLVVWATWGAAQEATYVLSGGQAPVAVVANGYVQSVTALGDGRTEVRVAVAMGPIGSEGQYAEIASRDVAGVPEHFGLPVSLGSELRPDISAWEAATRVLEWSAQRVEVDPSDSEPQDAVSVLNRGRGRCSGVANATAALLLAAGFEATTVSGLLISDEGWIPHRWVACRLPKAGWVHTDPTLGLWTVTPRHVTFPDAVLDPPDVRIAQGSVETLSALPRRSGLPMRPNMGSDLVCRAIGWEGGPPVVAVLTGDSGSIHRATLDPEGHFTALLPGRWRLTVMAGDRVVERHILDLRSGQVHSFTVTLHDNESDRGAGS